MGLRQSWKSCRKRKKDEMLFSRSHPELACMYTNREIRIKSLVETLPWGRKKSGCEKH